MGASGSKKIIFADFLGLLCARTAPCKVPDKTVHAGRFLQLFWLREPALSNGQRRMLGDSLVFGRESPNQIVLAVEDFEFHCAGRCGQDVVNNRAVRRVLSGGFFRGNRRALKAVVLDANSSRGPVQPRTAGFLCFGSLT